MAEAEQSESEPSKARSELYYLRSIAHEKSGDTSLGIEDARKSVESNRKDPKVSSPVIRLYYISLYLS